MEPLLSAKAWTVVYRPMVQVLFVFRLNCVVVCVICTVVSLNNHI